MSANTSFSAIALAFVLVLSPCFVYSQVPCNTSFTGFDPCSAEPLTVGLTCAASQEEFRINACGNFWDPGVSCGSDLGTNEVWGRFVTTSADTYTITWTPTNNRNLALHLYTMPDPCGFPPTFTEVACANANGSGIGVAGEETISMALPAATIYYVMGECLSHTGIGAGSMICVHSASAVPPLTASDCSDAAVICTDLDFTIEPNGAGAVVEFDEFSYPVSNPQSNPNPAPGNMGCLQSGELNTTWMQVHVAGAGSLEFSLGVEDLVNMYCYDWILWDYDASTCVDIPADTKTPRACNWNGSCESFTGMANPLPANGNSDNFETPLMVGAGEIYLLCFSNFSSAMNSVPLSFFGTANISCVALPTEFVGSQGECMPEGNRLTWQTQTESNNDFFTLERREGDSWLPIQTLNAAGNSVQVNEYEFMDAGFKSGLNYYRVKQTDFDGAHTYTAEVAIDNSGFAPIYSDMYYSNGSVHIEFEADLFELVEMKVYSISGQVLKEVVISEGGHQKVDLSDVTPGVYLVWLNKNGVTDVSKILIKEFN